MGKNRRVWLYVSAVLVGASLCAAVLGAASKGRGHARLSAAPNARLEAVREAKFDRDRGREGPRRGPSSPSEEQVANRAYPRSYVDDRRAQRSRQAYESLPV